MTATLRDAALAIGRAGVRAVDPARLARDALAAPDVAARLAGASAVRVVAVGKAAVPMWTAAHAGLRDVREALVVAPSIPVQSATSATFVEGGHTIPTAGSEAAAWAALALARRVTRDECLVLLVSGGASALMAAPAEGVSLLDKMRATRALLRCGARIDEINAVRKHLSAVKGGRLARAAGGRCVTLGLSDVIGPHEDDLSVIGSGPGVADPSTFTDALAVLEKHGLRAHVPAPIVRRLEAGVRGEIEESPKPGDADMWNLVAQVIGGRRDAMRGAAEEATRRGFEVHVVEAPLLGEAREVARRFVLDALAWVSGRRGASPVCVVASGEPTVTVTGHGRGGRNQEFALAAAAVLSAAGRPVALLSLGTDGVDGPTDAAGGLVDHTTVSRAAALGLSIERSLADNDAYPCLQQLGDLVVTGATGTNVGDLVVVTSAPSPSPPR